jgi:L-iditol 2-dehydrogenase
MKSMLAAVYHGPGDLRIEERPVPTIAASEVLVKVEAASICATDLRIWQGNHRKYGPGTVRIPGHELAGVASRVGSGVRGLEPGQRVFIAPNIGCGTCRACLRGQSNLCPDYEAFGITLDGAFAEYMRITAPALEQGNVIALPQGMDAVTAALVEPLACVLHGQETVRVGAGDVVLIAGAGPIGLMHLLLARQRGADRVFISDQFPARLETARALGADLAVNIIEEDLATVLAKQTSGNGADVVIVAAPSQQAQEQAVCLAGIGGRISFFAGMPTLQPPVRLDTNMIHYRELVLTGSTGCSPADCRRALALVVSEQVDLRPLVSHRFALRDTLAALAAAADRNGLKVVLEPGAG